MLRLRKFVDRLLKIHDTISDKKYKVKRKAHIKGKITTSSKSISYKIVQEKVLNKVSKGR